MNTLRYSRTMSLEDIISTTPELQDFISSLGLVPKTSPQDINQDNNYHYGNSISIRHQI